MAESWKRAVTNVSNRLFPGSAYNNLYAETDWVKLGNEIASNLPLQMSLYFNITFCPFWFISSVITLNIKYSCLSSFYQFIVVTIYVFIIVIECVRLYLGYIGNLTERVPELAGFWMLSLLLQFPLQMILFVDEKTLPQPMDRIMQCIMLIMLVIQLVCGFWALRTIARNQANHYHVMRFLTGSQSHSQVDIRLKSE